MAVGQEELQGVSGRAGENGNRIGLICWCTYCNFTPQPLAAFSQMIATRKASLVGRTLTCCGMLLCSLLLSAGPAFDLLALNLCMSWFISLTQQKTIWMLYLDLFSAQLSARLVAEVNVFQISIFLFFVFLPVVWRKKASHHDRMTKSITPLKILHVSCLSFLILLPDRYLACTVVSLPLLHLTWSFCFCVGDLKASHCYISQISLTFFVVSQDFPEFPKGFWEAICSDG